METTMNRMTRLFAMIIVTLLSVAQNASAQDRQLIGELSQTLTSPTAVMQSINCDFAWTPDMLESTGLTLETAHKQPVGKKIYVSSDACKGKAPAEMAQAWTTMRRANYTTKSVTVTDTSMLITELKARHDAEVGTLNQRISELTNKQRTEVSGTQTKTTQMVPMQVQANYGDSTLILVILGFTMVGALIGVLGVKTFSKPSGVMETVKMAKGNNREGEFNLFRIDYNPSTREVARIWACSKCTEKNLSEHNLVSHLNRCKKYEYEPEALYPRTADPVPNTTPSAVVDNYAAFGDERKRQVA